MGIRSRRSGSAYAFFQRKANERYDETMDSVADTMGDIMDEGVESAERKINSRGVEGTVPNTRGRGSGAMGDALGARVTRSGDVIHGNFGWLPGQPIRDEWGWQEDGTLKLGQPSGQPSPTPGTNRGIRPMLALHDAQQEARDKLARAFRGRRA